MKILPILGLSLLAAGTAVHAATDQLSVTYGYDFGLPAHTYDGNGGYAPSPDTGYVYLQNTGVNAFAGDIELSGFAEFAGPSDDKFSGVLLPGQSVVLLSMDEGSNVGGFNGTYGTPQNGLLLTIFGAFSDSAPLGFSVFDKDVHSGVFQLNPFGELLDNYILQGGSSVGFDTGDDFEVNQAHANFTVQPEGAPVPEVNAPTLLLGAGIAAAVFGQRRRQRATV